MLVTAFDTEGEQVNAEIGPGFLGHDRFRREHRQGQLTDLHQD